MRMERAVVLLSGGMDSATAAAWARARWNWVGALTVDYGQRHALELRAAEQVGKALGMDAHLQVPVGLNAFGGSALTDAFEVPKHRQGRGESIPVTYVPARNTVLLALLLAFAETRQAAHLVLGANALDFSGYPDCRPDYLRAFQRMANLGTRAGREAEGFFLHAPLLHLSKAGIVRLGSQLGVDFSLTFSCYDPPAEGVHCGTCDACHLRRRGFVEAGIPDPTKYAQPAADL
ncbi:MAG: 7-cyano-7-deazaguanine synthase QueC [Thermoanaerobaculum sp.]|nr:7-cyano-7-deazaguanine synthase QueC [Thermoanaerobaculum sp.]